MGVQTCANCPEGYVAVCQRGQSPTPVPPPFMPQPSPPRQLPTPVPPPYMPTPPVLPPWMPVGPRFPFEPTPTPSPPSGSCRAGQRLMSDGSCQNIACPAIALPPCPKGQYRTGECGLGPCTGPITPVPAPVPRPPAVRPPVIRPPINTGPIFYDRFDRPESTPITAPRQPQPMPLPAPAPAPIIRPQPVPVSSGQSVGNLIGGQRPPNYGLSNPQTDPFASMRDQYGNLPEAYPDNIATKR